MSKNKKLLIIISGTLSVLAIASLLIWIYIANNYKKKIPRLPDFQNISIFLQEQLSQAYVKAHRTPSAFNLGALAMVYHSDMYYDKAAVCYTLAIKRKRGNWIWNYYLGVLNQEMGDPKASIKNYREVIKTDPKRFLALYYEADCYQKTGLSDSAELDLKSIINRMDKNSVVKTRTRYDYFPLVTYAMYDLARIYLNTGRTELAEKTLLEIIDYQRSFGPAYRLLGNVYSIKGDDKLSAKFLVRANDLAIAPSPVDTLIDKLSLLSRSDVYLLKRIDEAEKNVFPEYALELVNHALTCFPENNYLVAKAIKLFLIRDMGKQALPYLDQHIKYFKDDFIELKSVGDQLYSKGFYTQAMNHYSVASKLKPDDSQVQSCIVICLFKEGKKKEALDMVYETLDKNKTNPAGIADGVTLLLTLGERENAIKWLSRLMKISPEFPKGHQLKGILEEQDGKWKEAISDYGSAFHEDSSDMTTVRLLGNLLIKQKLWEKAIAHFRAALDYHPNDPYILEKLGTLLVTCADPKLRDIEQGKDLCERAFIHTKSQSVTLISAGRSLAIAYAMLGDKKNASNVINKTINIASGEKVPQAYLDELRNISKAISGTN